MSRHQGKAQRQQELAEALKANKKVTKGESATKVEQPQPVKVGPLTQAIIQGVDEWLKAANDLKARRMLRPAIRKWNREAGVRETIARVLKVASWKLALAKRVEFQQEQAGKLARLEKAVGKKNGKAKKAA